MLKRQDWLQLFAYVGVSIVAVGMAFLISLKFLGSSVAQDENAPPSVEPPAAQAPATAEAPAVEVQPSPDATVTTTTTTMDSGIAELEGFLEPFIYDVVNRRDPFQVFSDYIPADEGSQRAISPAQRFDLDQLKLVGVMWDVKDPKAMFVDPQQEVLVLGRDESIGNKNGYIAAIREGEVVVVEAIRKRGDIIYRTRVLRIER